MKAEQKQLLFVILKQVVDTLLLLSVLWGRHSYSHYCQKYIPSNHKDILSLSSVTWSYIHKKK